MNETKIPFNISYLPKIKTGEYKVETREGWQAQYLCNSRFHEGLVFEIYRVEDSEVIVYSNDGINPGGNKIYDLFIVIPGQKLTSLEEKVLEVFDEIIDDYKLDISQSIESRLEYVNRLRKIFEEEINK